MSVSLNDLVEIIHNSLWESPDYRRYFDALWDYDSVEGSIAADMLMAAIMVREQARQHDSFNQVSHKTLTTIVRALGVVLRRVGMDIKSRRMIASMETGKEDQP